MEKYSVIVLEPGACVWLFTDSKSVSWARFFIPMKLRLPLSLLAALTALFVSIPASVHAVEVPEDYTSYYLADPDELYDFRSDSQNIAFLLDGALTVTPNSATWWKSTALKYEGSVLFTVEEDGDPYSLTFKDASYNTFDTNGKVRIEDIGRVTFSNIISQGAIESNRVQIQSNKSVIFENNQDSSGSASSSYGGAICGYGDSLSQVEVNYNYGVVTFTGNSAKASSSSKYTYTYARGGAIYGDVSIQGNRGDVSLSDNYVTSTTTNPSSSYAAYSYGGAIYGTSISFTDNASAVNLIGNYAFSSSSSSSAYSYGGAIYGTTVSLTSNIGDVSINNNRASNTAYHNSFSYGGAIYGTTISFANNAGDVSLCDNYVSSTSTYSSSSYTAYSYGGVIYGTAISIVNNGGVVSLISNFAIATHFWSRSYGGAIYGRENAQIIMDGNKGGICISKNYVDAANSYGGAIYGDNNTIISIVGNEGNINITENGFSETSSSTTQYGGAIYLNCGELNIRDNANRVTIKGNRAQYGGAFYTESSVINLEATKNDIVFEANCTGSAGGAIYGPGTTMNLVAGAGNIILCGNTAYSGSGGAVYGEGNTINICNNNGKVSFVDNTASYLGGAICDTNAVINICNNTGEVSFIGNSAQLGAAIYGGSLVIQNNESVVFERNQESSGRLRSLYLYNNASDGGKFHVSTAKGKSITFSDSVYVATGTSGQVVNVVFNGSYIASDETEIAQGGDIIFDGGQVEGVLRELMGTAPSAEQIAESQTSYVGGVTNLKAGRLIIRNRAHYNGLGISTTARSGAAVVLENAGMDHSSGSINIRRGTSLELSGANQITAGGLTLSSGSTLGFMVGAEQRETASLVMNANMDHFSITIALNGADMLASGRYKLVELVDASQYTSDDYWNADDITVTATGDAAGLGFDDLVWENGVLYVVQGKTIWNNGSGNGVWNAESANWQRNGVAVSYRDGMDVHFDDTAAGTVQLEGAISPLSVVVDNSTGHDYTFAGSGSLSGETSLVKDGSGALNLATANEYTGGTYVNGGALIVQHSQALGAAESTVVTAAGSQLNIENNAAVVLAAAEGNDLAGQVSVAAGSSLEVKGTGYHAEATQLAGELIFSGEGVNHTGEGAGSLSGSGLLKVQGAGSSVSFSSAADYSGSVALANGAKFSADTLVVKSGASLLALAAGTEIGLEDMLQPSTAQVEMHTTRFVYRGSFSAEMATNTYTAGTTLVETGLVLEAGASLVADCSSVDLGGSALALNAGGENPFVTLNLELDGSYTPGETQIVLFTGVSSFVLNGTEYSGPDKAFVFAASDYLKGDYVFETTALVYDGNVGCVYLAEALPEPTTTTLSLLALAGLAARRRRK